MKRLHERTKKHALSASIMQDLREEYLDTPTEISQTSRAQQMQSKQQQERQQYEEEYMTRLPISKSEKYNHRKLTTLGSLGDEITNFGSAMRSSSIGKRKKKVSSSGKSKGNGLKKRRFH